MITINTIKNENGFLIGKNTDAIGAKLAIKDADFNVKGKRVLILGAGGASRAIAFSLASECESIIIANRTFKKAKQLVEDLSQKTEVASRYIKFKSDIIEEVLEFIEEEIQKGGVLVHCASGKSRSGGIICVQSET